MARRRKRSETRARYFVRQESRLRCWNPSHVSSGGDLLEENEIVDYFPDIGLEPEFASWAAIWRSGFPEALESRARNSRRRL